MKSRVNDQPLSWWKTASLELYYRTTLPYRAWANWRRGQAGQAPLLILFYHRVADAQPNPWTMSRGMFAKQVHWLRKHFEMISLAEVQERMASGWNSHPAVSITFDDGYAENCDEALPLLLRHQIPFTYFISTDFVLTGRSFPHDLARGEPHAPNTPAQIRELAEAGVEIGVHTRNHPDLGRISDPTELYSEVVKARQDVERLSLRPARYFAFPFGQHANLSHAACALARRTGYAGICSAYGGYNFPGDDVFHLQRIHADPEMVRLKNWLTLDPRKLRAVRRFDFEEEPLALPATLYETLAEGTLGSSDLLPGALP